jgi:hypothetical protein
MDEERINTLLSTLDVIRATLDVSPTSWRDQLQAVRDITASLELVDTTANETQKHWQLPLITIFQRLAFTDADNGGAPDIANWCLRQAVTLLQLYPNDVSLLTCKQPSLSLIHSNARSVIGRNWLLRAQKSLARIHRAERDSSSSGGSSGRMFSGSEELQQMSRAAIEIQDRLHSADYVEARGILLPATEYLKRAVDAAHAQGILTGEILATVSSTYTLYHGY